MRAIKQLEETSRLTSLQKRRLILEGLRDKANVLLAAGDSIPLEAFTQKVLGRIALDLCSIGMDIDTEKAKLIKPYLVKP